MKICTRCKNSKSIQHFSKNRTERDGYSGWCKPCRSESYKARDKKDVKLANVKYFYGLSDEIYLQILQAQEFRCAICDTSFGLTGHKTGVIDHDHSCCPGKKSCGRCVRGILCGACNAGLGMFKDSSVALIRAIRYLQNANVEGLDPELSLELLDLEFLSI